MKSDFIQQIIEFFGEIEGLPEPQRDANGIFANWPIGLQKNFSNIISQIAEGGSDDDLLTFRDWWESYENKKIPQGIIASISRCFYDNPWLPSRQPMGLADARWLINSHNIPWPATVEAAGIIANSSEATFEDLLGLLKISGLPQEWAAIALYKKTKRPNNRPNPPSTDYNDWSAYLKKEKFISLSANND